MSQEALRFLVVEDDEVNAMFLRQGLAKQGHVVGVARDGEAALRMLEQEAWHMVLLDLKLPNINGQSLLQAIRDGQTNQPATIPVFVITGRAFPEDREAILKQGASAVLHKPLLLEDLYETIAAIIGAGEST